MSFRFKGSVVTLENYREIFKVCSPDILDEIRSAVLDDTPISSFIMSCGNDSYKLGQIRMALREMIPIEYLNAELTGKTIYTIRQGYLKSRDMSSLLRYYNKKCLLLDADIIEKIAEFVYAGTDISRMDFSIVPNKLVDIVCKGLYKGYPMWLVIEENCALSEDYVKVLMRGLSLCIDIHPFLSGNWDKNNLYLLFSYVKSVNLNEILAYINHNFNSDMLRTLLDLASKGYSISSLCVKDTDGFPVYNQYQMYELASAIEDDCITDAMYNVNLSDIEIQDMHNEVLRNKNRVLSAVLNKK